jgi:hypothetical protein
MPARDWPTQTSAYPAAPAGTPGGRDAKRPGHQAAETPGGRRHQAARGPRRLAAAGGPPGRPLLRVPPRQAAERPRQSRPTQPFRPFNPFNSARSCRGLSYSPGQFINGNTMHSRPMGGAARWSAARVLRMLRPRVLAPVNCRDLRARRIPSRSIFTTAALCTGVAAVEMNHPPARPPDRRRLSSPAAGGHLHGRGPASSLSALGASVTCRAGSRQAPERRRRNLPATSAGHRESRNNYRPSTSSAARRGPRRAVAYHGRIPVSAGAPSPAA